MARSRSPRSKALTSTISSDDAADASNKLITSIFITGDQVALAARDGLGFHLEVRGGDGEPVRVETVMASRSSTAQPGPFRIVGLR